jgi:hypothetical protein
MRPPAAQARQHGGGGAAVVAAGGVPLLQQPLPPAAATAPAADAEQQQLLAALRQPLFLQTPLQGLLEHLVQRLAASNAAAAELSRRVAGVEHGHAAQHDLLARLAALEVRLEAPASSATPFAVSQLAARVGAVEAAALRLEEGVKRLKHQSSEVRRQGPRPGRAGRGRARRRGLGESRPAISLTHLPPAGGA